MLAKHPTYVEMGNNTVNNKNKIIFIDFLGLLQRTMRGLQNLIVCTDVFTKNVSLYATGRPQLKQY